MSRNSQIPELPPLIREYANVGKCYQLLGVPWGSLGFLRVPELLPLVREHANVGKCYQLLSPTCLNSYPPFSEHEHEVVKM